MASGRNGNGISSFFNHGNFCILIGTGLGVASLALKSRADSYYANSAALKAQLTAAPTITRPSSLKDHRYSDGQLVFIENGVVSALEKTLVSASGEAAVLIKTVEHTDQPAGFERVFKGTHNVNVSRVPFALIDSGGGSDGEFRGVVVEAGADELPLDRTTSVKSPLYPPVYLSKTERFSDKEVRGDEIRVNMVTDESVLRPGTRVPSVFGRLRTSDCGGVRSVTIEACPEFPEGSFTSSWRSMIGFRLKLQTFEKAFPFRLGSIECGVFSLGFFLLYMDS